MFFEVFSSMVERSTEGMGSNPIKLPKRFFRREAYTVQHLNTTRVPPLVLCLVLVGAIPTLRAREKYQKPLTTTRRNERIDS